MRLCLLLDRAFSEFPSHSLSIGDSCVKIGSQTCRWYNGGSRDPIWEGLKFCRSGANLPSFYYPFSPDLGHFIFKLQNLGIFHFDVFLSFDILFGPVTGSLRRLEPHWRIPPNAPVFALMLLRRRRDTLRSEITEPSKLLVCTSMATLQS